MSKREHGFSVIEISIILVLAFAVFGGGYYVFKNHNNSKKITPKPLSSTSYTVSSKGDLSSSKDKLKALSEQESSNTSDLKQLP